MHLPVALVILSMALPLVLLAILVLRLQRARRLRGASAKHIAEAWDKVTRMNNPSAQLLEADKVLHAALAYLGYVGSTGEKLRHAEKRLPDAQAIWKAHKLRNRLAHELQATPTKKETQTAMRAYANALKSLGMR